MAGPITVQGRSTGEFCTLNSSMPANDLSTTVQPPLGNSVRFRVPNDTHPSRQTSSLMQIHPCTVSHDSSGEAAVYVARYYPLRSHNRRACGPNLRRLCRNGGLLNRR
jgi:hypothetical protein